MHSLNGQFKTATALLSQNRQTQPAGYDGGFGFGKLSLEGRQVKLPSLLALANDPNDYAPLPSQGSCVRYLSGARTDLIGQRWLGGASAYDYKPTSYLRVADETQGKALFGLQLLLAALGTLPAQDWDLELVVSLQDSQALGSELEQAFNGTHKVQFNSSAPVQVAIRAFCVEEGLGAIACGSSLGVCSPLEQNALVDLGFGTLISSVFRGREIVADSRKVLPRGADTLLAAISRNLTVRRHLKTDGDREIIRAGIERGDFLYGTTGWSFEAAYWEELAPWVTSALTPVVRALNPWAANTSTTLVTGGGSQLPGVADLLAAKKLKVLSNPQWANSQGLLVLSKLRRRA